MNGDTISDTFQFPDEIQEMIVKDDDILVLYDVSSMFTIVSVDETITILAEKNFNTDILMITIV